MTESAVLLFLGEAGHPWFLALKHAARRRREHEPAWRLEPAAFDSRDGAAPRGAALEQNPQVWLVRRANCVEVGRRLAARRDRRAAPVLLAAQRDCRPFEWGLRELGGADIWFSPREAAQLLRAADRLPREPRAEADDEPLRRVWRRLPWGNGADMPSR